MSNEQPVLRDVMARWLSGVTAITINNDGELKGMTASSFTSVSFNPPLILICVAKSLYTHEVLEEAGQFAVNILSTKQKFVAELFAGMHKEIEDRFAQIEYETANSGNPVLTHAAGWMDCKTYATYDGGDHTIFVGEVVQLHVNPDEEPLAYHNRLWGRFKPDEKLGS